MPDAELLIPGLRASGGGARELLRGARLNHELRAFLPLADTGGLSPRDISPYRRTSTLVNATQGAATRLGRATSFVSPNQLVNVGGTGANTTVSNLGLTGRTGSMALAARVFIPASTGSGCFFTVGGAGGFGLGIGGTTVDNTGAQIIGLYHNVRWIPTGANITTGWHDFAISLNASGHPTIYYDGAAIYTDTVGAPIAIGASDYTYIGTAQLGARFCTATIVAFRAWGRSLTAGEPRDIRKDLWTGTSDAAERLFRGTRRSSIKRRPFIFRHL